MTTQRSLIAAGSLATAGIATGTLATLIGRRRRTDRRTVCADPAVHERKVERIARQLRERTSHAPLVRQKRAVSHMVPKPMDLRHTDDKIDVRDLDRILSIDPVRRLCVAEAGVTFVDLVAATLKFGLAPATVPELKTITIGGAVAGCSIESMSFLHGGFHDTCTAYEVVTATGDVLHCTPRNEHRLIFEMMHGTFGTLGILTKLTFRLVPAKRFVHVSYQTFRRVEDYLAAIHERDRRRDVDFIDGILHAPTELVLSTGRFVDEAPYTSRYDRFGTKYFETTRTRREDYLRTADYFFRYDRGVTNVNPLLGSTQVLRLAQWIHRLLSRDTPKITLDVFVPFSRAGEFLTWYQREIGFFPLWCVPYRRGHDYEWLTPNFYAGLTPEDDLFLDLAIYGMEPPPGKNVYRLMEEGLAEVGGVKTLISHNYYSEDEFWRIWDKDSYDAVKRRTDPDNIFRDLYEKTCRAARGLP